VADAITCRRRESLGRPLNQPVQRPQAPPGRPKARGQGGGSGRIRATRGSGFDRLQPRPSQGNIALLRPPQPACTAKGPAGLRQTPGPGKRRPATKALSQACKATPVPQVNWGFPIHDGSLAKPAASARRPSFSRRAPEVLPPSSSSKSNNREFR